MSTQINDRYGEFSITLPVSPGHSYNLAILLMENAVSSAGQRVFTIQGSDGYQSGDIDIFSRVGFRSSLELQHTFSAGLAESSLTLTFLKTGPDNPKCNGIVLVDTSSSSDPPATFSPSPMPANQPTYGVTYRLSVVGESLLWRGTFCSSGLQAFLLLLASRPIKSRK